MNRPLYLALLATVLLPLSSGAETTTTVDDGGSVVTNLSSEASINRGSSLHRRWTTLHNSSMPLDLKDTTGIRTEEAASGAEGYVGRASMVVSAREPIAAYEVRVLVFNVWGEFLRTYSCTRVTDLSAGDDRSEAHWRIFDSEEAGYVYSLTYVARVMTREGRVATADEDAVLAEARKISPHIKRENLLPKKEIWLGGSIMGHNEVAR